ncbi:DUF4426 domain-containing protein [Lysobacter sp. K5869]|uniref:DUF4426 domain-containing protein n=1 Tax=Lysobacter sp. K5869 TaxID=2820808 RepID=UPI001C061DE9|nr:DUF4426 domain-containing protein [Lysobacter sp. K5869]QWP76543.1 DUF4426 domain-containing protein [Lysobacter sp. K5869]
MSRLAIGAIALALLAGCGREASVPPAQGNAAGSETVRIGAVAMHATAVQTDKLPEQVVRRYGAPRDARTVLLVMSLRQGEEADAKALTAQRAEATVTDLLGRKQTLTLREVRDGDLVDYVGTAQVSPPDTLRFEVTMVGPNGRHSMKFNRDFF